MCLTLGPLLLSLTFECLEGGADKSSSRVKQCAYYLNIMRVIKKEVFRYTAVSFEFSANLEKTIRKNCPLPSRIRFPAPRLVRGCSHDSMSHLAFPQARGRPNAAQCLGLSRSYCPSESFVKGMYPITNSCVQTTHPPLDGSVVIFITSNGVISDPDLGPCQTLLYKPILTNLLLVPYEARALFGGFSYFSCPRLRLLLHRPHCKPRQSPRLAAKPVARALPHLHRVAQFCKFPQLVF